MSELGKDSRRSRPWLSWAVLLLLLGVALALRWRYVREISLFVDEFVTAWAARNVLSGGLPRFPSGNFYPHGLTFTYLTVPFLAGGDFNETLARIPALLVSLAGLPLAYWIGRRLFSEPVGLVAAAAMAVDPDCIVWGGRVRMYGLLQLLTLLVVYFAYRGLAEDRVRDRYLAMILLVVAIFTHLEAAFLLPALGLAALVLVPWRRLLRPSVVLPVAIAAAGAGVFVWIATVGQPGHLETLQETRPYLALSANILSGPMAFAPIFTSPHRLPFSLLALVGIYFLFRPGFDRRSPLLYLYVILVAMSLLLLLAGTTWQRERYFFLVLPLLFLLGGEVLNRILGRLPALGWPRPWQTALLALAVALYVGLTGAPGAYVQEWGYDRAFRTLQERFDPAAGDRVVTSMSTAARLYLGQNDAFAIQQGYEEYVVPDGDGRPVDLWTATPLLTTTQALVDLLAEAPRVWFVVDGWRFQTRYQPDFILAVLEQMDLVYNERGVLIFRGEGLRPAAEPAFQRQRRAEFSGELALTGFDLSALQPAPGDELQITLHWQALEEVGPAYTAFLHLIGPDGTGVAGVDEPVLQGLYQPDLWPRDRSLPDRHTLTLPADLPPGRYRLDLGLYRPGQAENPLPVGDGDRLPLATLTIGPGPEPPASITPAYLDYGQQIRLLGYDLQRLPGRELRLILYWQSLQPAERDYTTFVHLVDAEGAPLVQDDRPPGDAFLPTTTWLPGDVYAQEHTLTLPANAPAGDYALLIGLYHQPTGERLAVTDAHGQAQGDAFRLEPISFESGAP